MADTSKKYIADTHIGDRKWVAEMCTRIINEPEENVNEVSTLLKSTGDKGLLFLSLTKVFKNIAPLYRIRLHSNKVKHKSADLSITEFDKKLFTQYNLFVRDICRSDAVESYKAAAELLKTLDHFNFSDRIVAKVLLGTTKSRAVAECCIEAITDRIKNDRTGETIFMILDRCLDYRFNHLVVKAMLDSEYLQMCVKIRIDKEEFYLKESIERRKQEKKEKRGKGFFAKKALIGKKDKKDEKMRLRMQSETRTEEKADLDPINNKNYIRTVNAMQRLYFTLLKNKEKICFEDIFVGVRKYIRIIRKEFHEGLYTLLLEAIRMSDVSAGLEGVISTFEIYKNSGYDFKRLADVLFKIISPFNYQLSLDLIPVLCTCVRHIFIDIVQSKMHAVAFTQRLMHSRLVRHILEFDKLIKDLEIKYNLEFTDFDINTTEVKDIEVDDISKIPQKPFYEYFPFRRVI